MAALFPELGVTVGDNPDSGTMSTSAMTRDGSLQSTRESLDDGEEGIVSPLPSPGLGSIGEHPS